MKTTEQQQPAVAPNTVRVYLTKGICNRDWGGTDLSMVEGFAEMTAAVTGKPVAIECVDIPIDHPRQVHSIVPPDAGRYETKQSKRRKSKVA